MVVSSTLTNQLATLGIVLPAWPEEPAGDCSAENWIQIGKDYAEGLRVCRAHLRESTEGTKTVVATLLEDMKDTVQFGVWDSLVYSSIKPEVQESSEFERCDLYTKLIHSSEFTPAQLLGIALDLAQQQRVEIATQAIAKLIRENEQLEMRTKSLLLAEFVCTINTYYPTLQANADWPTWNQAICFHQKITEMLAVSLIDKNKNDFTTQPESSKNQGLIDVLDEIASPSITGTYNNKTNKEEDEPHELIYLEQENNSSILERPNSRLKRVKSFNKQYMNDIPIELDRTSILENFEKFITISKQDGFTSSVEIKRFHQETIVIKTYKDSTQLTKVPESFTEESYNNELNALKRLDSELYFPRLIDYDTRKKTITMSYAGIRLGSKPSEVELQKIPNNWKEQFYYILTILKKHNLYHNDITERNICINKGILTLIDYGNCKSHVDTYYRNFGRETLEKSENILDFLFQINSNANQIRNCLHGSN